jgi:hypothetical protein
VLTWALPRERFRSLARPSRPLGFHLSYCCGDFFLVDAEVDELATSMGFFQNDFAFTYLEMITGPNIYRLDQRGPA